MASSESSGEEEIIGFRFEPRRNPGEIDSDEESWETVSCSSSSSSDDDTCVMNQKRTDVEATMWCQCGNCQRKTAEVECVCCHELEKSKTIVARENISKEM